MVSYSQVNNFITPIEYDRISQEKEGEKEENRTHLLGINHELTWAS